MDSSRKRALRWAALLALMSFLSGCGALRRFQFGMKPWGRPDPDYAAMEAERAESRDDAQLATVGFSQSWPRYRGPGGLGIYAGTPVVLDATEKGPEQLWSVALGPAYSSAIIARGIVITMEQRREEEVVVAFALADGALLWESAWPGRFSNSASKEGPRTTPAVEDDALVALGAMGELRCLDRLTGKVRWRRSLLSEGEENLEYGLSASPVIHRGTVYASGANSLHAVDLATGEVRWQCLSERLAYATPQVGEILGEEVLVTATAKRVVGIGLAGRNEGKELWSFPWAVSDGMSCTQPILLEGSRVLVSAGNGKGAQLVRLVRTGAGIVAEGLWRSSRLKARFNEPVVRDGFAYGLDEGALVCLDLADGSRAWKGKRFGYGQVLGIDQDLLVVDEDGEVSRLRASPDGAEILISFPGVDGGVNLSSPAIADGRLVLRNDRELVCYDVSASWSP